jgi:hypothetical protein
MIFHEVLTCYNEDFGALAEWHFFATSHGKSACDGIGGKPVCSKHMMTK